MLTTACARACLCPVTGFPVVQLYVSSSTNDASLFVYLICIDTTGKPHYVTEVRHLYTQIQC